MRRDAATALKVLGYLVDTHFIAQQRSGETIITVLSGYTLPSEAEIDAVDLTAYHAAEQAKVTDKEGFRTQFEAAVTRLQAIRDQGDSRTNLQAQRALTDMATIMLRHLKVTKASI